MKCADELTFKIGNLQAGWATVLIVAGRQRIQVQCSYVCDSLGDLLRGLAHLRVAPGKFEVQFTTEDRGGYLLAVRRDGDSIELTAKRFASDWDESLVEKGRQTRARLRWRGPLEIGLSTFAAAFAEVLGELGSDGYKAAWWHPFPQVAFDALQMRA